MTNRPYGKSALAHVALDLTPPLIQETLLEEPGFREDYGFTDNAVLSFGDSGVSVQRSDFFDAVRMVLSGVSERDVTDMKGQEWKLKDISGEEELPNLIISRGEQLLSLSPDLAALSPDRGTRLCFLDKAASEVNLPNSASVQWRNVLSERALGNEELNAFHGEFGDTPVEKARTIHSELMGEQIRISSLTLVPHSRRYFERLVGEYHGSASIRDYASGNGRTLFDQLSAWGPYEGFLFSLFLSSHSSLTDIINVDQLNSEDLSRALDFLENHGDRISQLGAIEVGLRVLPSRPEIEQALVRLIEQIRDDDVGGQASGFKLLAALFCLVDGELSGTRLFPVEPPFYRRLAALSQAALIHRQLVNSTIGIDRFSNWASENRGWQHYLQSLADLRLEPRWDPDLATASQLKAEFFGRIMNSAKNHKHNITGSHIYDLVFGDDAISLQSLSDFPYPWLPGPLEGTEVTQRILPSEVVEAIETQLSEENVEPSSFIALVNSALIYGIGADQAKLAAEALKGASYRLLNIESRLQLVTILNGLATVAAVVRSPALAGELRILVRKYRHDAEYALSIQEVIKICLVAAASHSDLSEWTKFVSHWFEELAFGDLKDEEGHVFYTHLNWLCHTVPELWVSCGRANAAVMAFNSAR